MRKIFLIVAIALHIVSCAQPVNVINSKETDRIERILSSDDMQGRRTGTAGIEKAARFIADEFKKAGLQPVNANSFLQEFSMIRPKFISVKGEIDGVEIEGKKIIVMTSVPDLKVNEKAGYDIDYIKAGENFNSKAQAMMRSGKNKVVFVDTGFTKNFPRLTNYKRQMFKIDNSVVFILGNYIPKNFTIKAEHTIEESKLANVVGVLPGKSKKNEYVIFSAHYDHLGIGKPVNGDSIYNGANDDAAGTTAVIMLAYYFKALNNNERTIVFAAFTAEEVGGFGSQYFSRQYDAQQVVAMFNIEMIGTQSKWGKNSAYITGFERTDMGTILQENLIGSAFTFHPDPYPKQDLFYRSDNATLARLGVPAHTISTSKMEEAPNDEPNYHKPSDEIGTLNMENMAQIIEAIAVRSKTIISGKATPKRVKVEELR